MYFYISVDASNTTSPPQASSNNSPSSTQSVEKPIMTSSDKLMSSPHDSSGRNQPNSNSSIYHPDNTTSNNINNNNHSQNTENNYNNDALNKSSRCQDSQEDGPVFRSHHLVTPDNDHRKSQKSPSHDSHFSGGSGLLADTPPKRPERRQYVNKSKLNFI